MKFHFDSRVTCVRGVVSAYDIYGEKITRRICIVIATGKPLPRREHRTTIISLFRSPVDSAEPMYITFARVHAALRFLLKSTSLIEVRSRARLCELCHARNAPGEVPISFKI